MKRELGFTDNLPPTTWLHENNFKTGTCVCLGFLVCKTLTSKKRESDFSTDWDKHFPSLIINYSIYNSIAQQVIESQALLIEANLISTWQNTEVNTYSASIGIVYSQCDRSTIRCCLFPPELSVNTADTPFALDVTYHNAWRDRPIMGPSLPKNILADLFICCWVHLFYDFIDSNILRVIQY